MNRAEHYAYRVRWSAEDEAYVGTVAEFPSLSWVASVSTEAFAGIRQLAADTVDDMMDSGEQPPAAIADRTYSGKFQVRVPPELHRQLTIEAAEQNVSLNRLAALRLGSCTSTAEAPRGAQGFVAIPACAGNSDETGGDRG